MGIPKLSTFVDEKFTEWQHRVLAANEKLVISTFATNFMAKITTGQEEVHIASFMTRSLPFSKRC